MQLKRFMELLAYKAIRLVFLMLGLIPETLATRMANIVGGLWYRMDKRHRDAALENMTIAFGHKMSRQEIVALSRKAFDHIALVPFEMGRSLRWRWQDVWDRFRLYGVSHLAAAHKKGKGVLVLTCHMGNWEFLPTSMAASGFQIAAVYRPLDFKPMDRFILEMRKRFGCRMYPTKNAVKGIFDELGRGNCVGLLSDQNAPKRHQGVFVEMFGRKASAHNGIAQLALATGAPVVPYFVARDGKFVRGEFGPEIPLVNTGDLEADILTNTQNYSYAFEKMIRKYPEQWFWVHRRWKTRPLDEVEG
jgi:KDO2-lipid IV(A) lauroyltransferase